MSVYKLFNPKIETMSVDETEKRGIPYFNPWNHTVVDLTESTDGNGGHTVVLQLPNGHALTVSLIGSRNIDVAYHGDGHCRVIGFKEEQGKPSEIHDDYGLVCFSIKDQK